MVIKMIKICKPTAPSTKGAELVKPIKPYCYNRPLNNYVISSPLLSLHNGVFANPNTLQM